MHELQLFKVQKISIHLYFGSHVGTQKNAFQPIFPYNIIEKSPTSLAHNSVFIGPNDFKFGTETRCGLIGNTKIWGSLIIICKVSVFDDVICKPPINEGRSGMIT